MMHTIIHIFTYKYLYNPPAVFSISLCCVLFLKYAEGQEWIEKNPMQFAELPSVEQKHSRALTDEEIKTMWSIAKCDRIGAIAFPLLLGLEWEDSSKASYRKP